MLAIRICGTDGQSRPGKAKCSLYSGSRIVSYGFWRIFRVKRLRPRRHVLSSQKCGLSRWSCKATVRLTGKSMFARPKIIAPSWLKVVADGQDVATRGLSIGLLLASTDDMMELLLLLTREMHSIVGRA